MLENVSGIIMASGYSRRMGSNKLFLSHQGKTFIEHALSLLLKADLYEVILVISEQDLKELIIPKKVKVVVNNNRKLGQSQSVKLGTRQATGDGYLYLPIDQPCLTVSLIKRLQSAGTKETIVFPEKKGKPSSPVLFGAKFRQELLEVSGETGGREVRNRHEEVWQRLSVDEEQLIDIDTPEDLEKLAQLTCEN